MKNPLPQREGIFLEYKEAGDSLPKKFFETACAFLNRDGGLIVSGIAGKQAGCGVYNVSKYLPQYTPSATPLFEELKDFFSATIPLPGEDETP